MYVSDRSSLGLRRIAEEWSKVPGALTKLEILSNLLSAFWRGEFKGADTSDRKVTLNTLNLLGATAFEYLDDKDRPFNDFDLPGDHDGRAGWKDFRQTEPEGY